MKGSISFLIRTAISLVFIGILVWFVRKDIPDIVIALKSLNPLFFLIAAILNIFSLAVISLRLKKILSFQGVNIKLREAIYLNFIGNFFNNFLPTSVGGDLVKGYYATKKSSKKLESFSAIFFDRFFGFLSMGLLAFLGVLFLNKHIKDSKLFWGAVVFSAGVLLVFILFMNKNLTKRLFSFALKLPIFKEGSGLRKLYNALNSYKEHKVMMAQLIGISLAAQMIAVLAIYVIIRSLSQEISFLNLFLIIPLVSTASMMPSINGLGVREGAFVYFLKEFISKESAFAASLLYLGLILIISFIGGVLYLFSAKLYKVSLRTEMES
ncbi:MAG: lysylphosphatidylglycerol synthase transmembrane domain-containing protein [Candidatus Omnitrophota bacterium]